MTIRAACVVLLLSSLVGCGTVKNTVLTRYEDGGKAPFGGVHADMKGIDVAEHNSQLALALLCAADVPLSAVGDVLMLPYTWSYSYINQPIPVPQAIPTAPRPQAAIDSPTSLPSPSMNPPGSPTTPGPSMTPPGSPTTPSGPAMNPSSPPSSPPVLPTLSPPSPSPTSPR